MSEQSTRTVDRALSLLAYICDAGGSTLVEASRAVELSPSTALRLLRTLESRGFLRRDDEATYRPGPRLLQLGARSLSHEAIIDVSHDEMKALSGKTGESVYLSVEGHDDSALYISIVEGSHSVRHTSWVGRSVPLTGSAAGVVLRGHTPETGYVVVGDGIERDVTAVAAPVVVGQRVAAALSILVPSYRMTPERTADVGALVAASAEQLSRAVTTGATVA
ncbi:helix-turn-helix domain-containing protein [Microbacterium enclense]|uniref:IclR family transcriptional regulator n=1 Tax=Microbacterium enclense TaxID=993073 RepID=UPI0021A3CCB4|nr:helix-turn-helix domain-containing protein [Microbacterium enclense]MCT2085147.1 helix-turn-helix domain-containing protein [Microbacterium enclense]